MSLIKLESFENVGEDKTALCKTTRLYPHTLEYIAIVMGGTVTKANLEQVKVKFGTKTAWDVTGSQLNSINLYEGRTATATVLILPFANMRARHLEQQYLGAPDFMAMGIRSVDLELKVNGATDPITFEAWASIAPPKLLSPSQNLLFRALIRQPLSYNAAVSEIPIPLNYGQAGGALLRRLYLFSNAVTELKIKRDGLDYFEEVTLALNNAIQDEHGWDPQANIYTFNAIDDDNELKALTSIRDDGQGGSLVPQQFLLTLSGAATFDTVADVFTNINGI